MTYLDLVEDAVSRADGRMYFLPDRKDGVPISSIWRQSESAARWFGERLEGSTVSAVLAPTPEALAVLLGAWRAGVTVASLPYPGRGASPDEYQRQIVAISKSLGSSSLLLDPTHALLVPPDLGLEVTTFPECFSTSRTEGRGASSSQAQFIQFTSGTTQAPKGVALSLAALGSNVAAILESLDVGPGDVSCSWLPLSHDMGLIGMCLTPLAAAINWPAGGYGEVVLIRPEAFLASPGVWLRTCSEFGASITAAPNFALDLVARRGLPSGSVNLRTLRACITGAEPVRGATLRTFAAATAEAGLEPRSLCPAYGLAEGTLAVTLTRPSEAWRSRYIDHEAMTEGMWVETSDAPGALEVVSCGKPLRGIDVRCSDGESNVSQISFASSALFEGYVVDGMVEPADSSGWFTTADLGRMIEGELYVVGRTDDIVLVGGKKVSARVVEAAASRHSALRPGNCAFACASDGSTLLISEVNPEASNGMDYQAAFREIRALIRRETDLAPDRMVFVRRGSLPKTPSGKLQRYRAAEKVESGQVAIEAEWGRGPRSSSMALEGESRG